MDYLPRKPFLVDFVSKLFALNPQIAAPQLKNVNWEKAELHFWPYKKTENDDAAEPDLIIITNLWILVVEVKLHSDLGHNQPWREYQVGQKVAAKNGVSSDSVYYLLLTKSPTDVRKEFNNSNQQEYEELLCKTFYLLWHQAKSIIEGWLRVDNTELYISASNKRMLNDLVQALRKRRTLSFSGFTFENILPTYCTHESLFCPALFSGFLKNGNDVRSQPSVFFTAFNGFCLSIEVQPSNNYEKLLDLSVFSGFTLDQKVESVDSSATIFAPTAFKGFLGDIPQCNYVPTIFLTHNLETQ